MFRRAGLVRAPAPSTSFTAVALGISDATQKRLAEIVAAGNNAAAAASSSSAAASSSSSTATIPSNERQGLSNEIKHVRRCNAEIARLLKWSEVKTLLGDAATKKAALSSAELIHLTAFTPSATVHGRNDDHIHDAGCPIQAGELTMATAALGEKAPTVAPCKHCLRRRLNFLASEHFAHALHWNSTMPSLNKGNHINNQKVYQLVRESFGSMRALEDTLAEFAVNRRDAGFTWLVYNPQAINNQSANPAEGADDVPAAANGRLEVVNLPGSTSPVVLGMWPILAVNVTTETIMDALAATEAEAATSAATAAQTLHSWSRAARNKDSAVTRQSVVSTDKTLSELRRAAADRQCKAIDIGFMEAQVGAALAYFSSSEFVKAAADRKQELAAQAQSKVVKSFDNLEMDAVNAVKKASTAGAEAEKKAKAEKEAAEAKAAKKAGTAAKKDETTSASTATAAAAATTSAAAAAVAATEEAPAPKAAEPAEDVITAEGLCDDGVTRYTTRSSGITSYAYENGTSTDVYPDGRQVTYTPDLTTTTYPDGTVHYLYANGATVEIRADGTKYVNGELSTE